MVYIVQKYKLLLSEESQNMVLRTMSSRIYIHNKMTVQIQGVTELFVDPES